MVPATSSILGFFLILYGLFASQVYASFRDLPQITVLAASSLTKPLTELARIYSRSNNITVTTSYDETARQAKKIEEGSQADIFISLKSKHRLCHLVFFLEFLC